VNPINKQQTDRTPSLDGLRAISIILVLFGHLCGTRGFFTDGKSIAFLGLSNFGVRVFFVISGYLITGLLLREMNTTGGIHLLKFYFRRTFRIFPAYYAFLLFLIFAQPLGFFPLEQGDILHTLTYTSNYHPMRSWYVGHTWSLSVEEQFYLLWPATLLLLGRRKGFGAAVIFILLSPLIRWSLFHWFPLMTGIGHQFETIADSLATGCALACRADWPQWVQQKYDRLLHSKWMILVPFIALICYAPEHPHVAYLVGFSIANIGIAICVDWCIRNPETLIGKILNSAPLVFIGLISYSIYLWQQLFLNRNSTQSYAAFPFNLVLAAAFALGSYYWIERPSLGLRQRLERRLFSSAKAEAPSDASPPVLPIRN